MAFHNELGKRGEEAAAEFLKKKGYKIIERNWGFGDLEVDIIAQDGDAVVFVEVKTRSSNLWGRPEDAVDERRKRRMQASANAYMKYHKLDKPCRMDVIAIIMNGLETNITHYENAFHQQPRFFTGFRFRPSSSIKNHRSTRYGKPRKKI